MEDPVERLHNAARAKRAFRRPHRAIPLCLAATVSLAGPASHAQAAHGADPGADESPPASRAATRPGTAKGTAPIADKVEAVTVTAERRGESIQRVPLSVTAVSGLVLQQLGIKQFADYAHLSPDLSFGTGNGFGVTTAREVTIRGIAGSNTTSFYINDTPVPLSLDPRVLDLQRIEILRGPQGTLFGASSMGGTVRLITRPAEATSAYGSIDAEGFDVNHGGAGTDESGTYNLPIIKDQLGLKVSGYGSFSPGYFKRVYGVSTTPGYVVPASQQPGETDHVGSDGEFGGMATLTYTPAVLPNLTITPMAIYQSMIGNGLPLADFNPSNLTQLRPLNVPEGVADKWSFEALTARYETGIGRIISSSTYLHRQSYDDEDGTEAAAVVFGGDASPPLGNVYSPSPSPSFVNTKSFSQEFRFESAFRGPVQLVAGGFYNYSFSNIVQREYGPYDSAGELFFEENIPGLNRELAGFVNFTYAITKRLSVSAGVREARLQYQSAYIADGWVNGGPSDSPASHHENAATPRFTAQYQITPRDMVYTSIAKGYRIGGQNAVLPSVCDGDLAAAGLSSGTTSYNSDSLWSYEIGAKDGWFDNRVQTRAALYRIDWSGIQQSILLPCTYHLTLNAGGAVSQGGELEASLVPLNGLKLTAALGYDDAHITTSPAGGAFQAGQALNGVPKYTASLTGEYTVPTRFGSVFVRGQYSFTGQSLSYNNDPNGLLRKSYELLNTRFGSSFGAWEAALFINNVFDIRGNLGDEQSEVSEIPGRARYLITQPRTIGLDVRRSF